MIKLFTVSQPCTHLPLQLRKVNNWNLHEPPYVTSWDQPASPLKLFLQFVLILNVLEGIYHFFTLENTMNREGKKKNIYENSTIDRACMSQPQIPASLTLHKLHPLERLFLLSYPPLSRMHKSSLQWILLETCSP